MKTIVATAASAIVAYELERHHQISHDLKTAFKLGGFGRKARISAKNGITTADLWEATVRSRPKQNAIIFADEENEFSWTFQEMDGYANRVANFLLAQGLNTNDDIALFMENRPEFIAIWLGIAKIGARATLLNTAIREKSLFHCVTVNKVKAVIYGMELEEALLAIRDRLPQDMKFWGQESSTKVTHLDQLLQAYASTAPPRSVRVGVTS
jgi:solute carrier family 27 fatty acid transporter 1/4